MKRVIVLTVGIIFTFSFFISGEGEKIPELKFLFEIKEELKGPEATAFDENGNIYVADSYSQQIVVFNENGKFWFKFSSPKMRIPTGIVVKSDKIYVTDLATNDVKVFSKSGDLIKGIGSPGKGRAQFIRPKGIAIDDDNNIYIADSGNHRIQIFDGEGRFKGSFGSYGMGEGAFNCPSGITIDNKGKIYVTDMMNSRVQVFDKRGNKFLYKFGSPGTDEGDLMRPRGVSVDNEGFIYVASSDNCRIEVFNQKGRFILNFGEFGEKPGQFNQISLSSLHQRRYALADPANKSVSIFEITYFSSISPEIKIKVEPIPEKKEIRKKRLEELPAEARPEHPEIPEP